MIHLLSLTAFGEYVIRSRHGVIFETLGSLLSLLRTGARDAYRQFFADAMLVIQGKKRGGGDERSAISLTFEIFLQEVCCNLLF